MEEKGIALTILGVVAIISIVGLVLLFVNKPAETRVGEGISFSERTKVEVVDCVKFCESIGYWTGGCHSKKICEESGGDFTNKACTPWYPEFRCCCFGKKKTAESTQVAVGEY